MTRCTMGVLAALLLVLVTVPGTAAAALPAKGTRVQAHDHDTPGRNWHVQMSVSKTDRRLVETLVVYAEICKATILKTRIPIAADGTLSTSGAGQGKGTVTLTGTFTDKETVEGTVRISRGSCDTGEMQYK